MARSLPERGLTDLARRLRRNLTEPERILWNRLRADALGVHFRRQHPIGRYIADFVCVPARLVVEIDGDTHADDGAEAQDRFRSRQLGRCGVRVVRFTNRQVMDNLEGVLEVIRGELSAPLPPPPLPLAPLAGPSADGRGG